jgi:hypothetical protein
LTERIVKKAPCSKAGSHYATRHGEKPPTPGKEKGVKKGANHSLSSLGSFAGICLEKILPVHVTSENILPAVPTAHDVINRSRIFHSQLARHAGKTTSSIPIPSRLWFDPF